MYARSHVVLVVDDDLAVRESLKFALELEGLEVHACAGGADLLDHPQLMHAACLVVDYQMPANGWLRSLEGAEDTATAACQSF